MRWIDYKIKRYIYILLKKDCMKLDLKYYKSLGVKFGKNMRAFSPLISSEPYLLEFGDNVTISGGVNFITHDNSVIKLFKDATDVIGSIKIGNNCFIGYGSIILPGVELGNNIIVAAGSVVTKSFNEDGIIIGGNPAKKISSTKEYKLKIKNNLFDMRGLSYENKKRLIQNNENKYLKK